MLTQILRSTCLLSSLRMFFTLCALIIINYMIVHIQGAETDRYAGVCSDWTLSLPGSCPPGQLDKETRAQTKKILHNATFPLLSFHNLPYAVLLNSVHPYARPVWSVPLHGSGLTEWYPGRLCLYVHVSSWEL